MCSRWTQGHCWRYGWNYDLNERNMLFLFLPTSPVMKKERNSSCVPLCENCISLQHPVTKTGHSIFCSHRVSEFSAKPFCLILLGPTDHKELAFIGGHFSCPSLFTNTVRLEAWRPICYSLTCFFFPSTEGCGLSAAVAGGICGILWEAHWCAVAGASEVSGYLFYTNYKATNFHRFIFRTVDIGCDMFMLHGLCCNPSLLLLPFSSLMSSSLISQAGGVQLRGAPAPPGGPGVP